MTDTSKPLLIWDGDCGFCQRSTERLHRIDGQNRFESITNLEFAKQFPEQSDEARARKEILLRLPNGTIIGGADAILKLLSMFRYRGLFRVLGAVPFIWVARFFYRAIANNRILISKILRIDSSCKIN